MSNVGLVPGEVVQTMPTSGPSKADAGDVPLAAAATTVDTARTPPNAAASRRRRWGAIGFIVDPLSFAAMAQVFGTVWVGIVPGKTRISVAWPPKPIGFGSLGDSAFGAR